MSQRDTAKQSGTVRIPLVSRVLIVEDDPLLTRAMARHLWSEQYRLKIVGTCEEAFDAGFEFDVGVFDVGLPDGNGIDLARELLEEGTVERAIFFSANASEEVARQAMRLGSFVRKEQGLEVLAHVLRATFESVLNRRMRQASVS